MVPIEMIAIGCVISIIGYFLKETMTRLKVVEKDVIGNINKIAILERDAALKHAHLNEKIDHINEAIKDLTVEVKILIKEINKRWTIDYLTKALLQQY